MVTNIFVFIFLKFNFKQPILGERLLDPCDQMQCYFGSSCERGACICPDTDCLSEPIQAVCGSNGITYMNHCELQQSQCSKQERITLQYFGLCIDISTLDVDCKDSTECHHGAICNVGACRCPVCEEHNGGDICGSDFNTYRSECDLKRRACKEGRDDLSKAYGGICRICQPVYWDGEPTRNDRYCGMRCEHCKASTFEKPVCDVSSNVVYRNECFAKCVEGNKNIKTITGTCLNIQDQNQLTCPECKLKECRLVGTEWKCICPLCPSQINPVCATNGISYPSQCVLERTNCEFETAISIRSQGECDSLDDTEQSHNVCGQCDFLGYCEDGFCSCNFACSTYERPVCGSDNITYRNQCQLLLAQCKNQTAIQVKHEGSCNREY